MRFEPMHAGGVPHVPELHDSPLQQALVEEQVCPEARHTGGASHSPATQVKALQHALEEEQL